MASAIRVAWTYILGVARKAAMSARFCCVRMERVPMPPRLLLMADRMVIALLAPLSTLLPPAAAGPWQLLHRLA